MSCSQPIPFGFYVILQTELTRNRTNVLYGLQLRSGTCRDAGLNLPGAGLDICSETMTIEFLGDRDQATLPLQLLLIGLSANDNLMTGNGSPSS